jgi:hypothetical protein
LASFLSFLLSSNLLLLDNTVDELESPKEKEEGGGVSDVVVRNDFSKGRLPRMEYGRVDETDECITDVGVMLLLYDDKYMLVELGVVKTEDEEEEEKEEEEEEEEEEHDDDEEEEKDVVVVTVNGDDDETISDGYDDLSVIDE